MALADTDLLVEARDRARAKAFVETGTHRGDGLALALRAGFEDCYSVELSPFSYGWASHRFRRQNTRVHLHHGDSAQFLRKLLVRKDGIYGPCVFWLDAHWCGGDGEMEGEDFKLRGEAPLLDELGIIAQHRCPTNAILIDDVRNFGRELPDEDTVRAAVLAVNPDFEIRYADGRDFERDILVALPPELEEES